MYGCTCVDPLPRPLPAAPHPLRWPDEPMRSVLVTRLSQLGVARFAQRYPALCSELLRSLLELTVKYYKTGELGAGLAQVCLVWCGVVGSGRC